MTPQLVAQAATLYAQNHSLEEVGRLLELEARTVGKALKRAGVNLAAGRRSLARTRQRLRLKALNSIWRTPIP